MSQVEGALSYHLPAIQSIAKLAEALAKAQGKIQTPKKGCKVDFTNNKGQRVKYNYADLADVLDAIRGPFSDNGLSVIHKMVHVPEGFGLITMLLHSSGECIETWYPLPDPENKEIRPQEFGSALTYARRYSVSSLVGIASEEDDDGASAATRPATNDKKPAEAKTPPKPPVKKHAPQAESKPDPRDPAQFVMPFGENTAGKKLADLPEATLIEIKVWCAEEMKKTPPPKGIAQIIEVNRQVLAFLKSVGIS